MISIDWKKVSEISFFMPACKEEENIEIAVKEALKVCKSIAKKFEIIVVGGCPFDKTDEIVKKLSKRYKNIRLVKRDGIDYGEALKKGFETSNYELIFYSDSDLQFDFKGINKLLLYINEFDLVVGVRVRRKDKYIRKIISKIFTLLIFFIFRKYFRDPDCAFKLVKKKVIKRMTFRTSRSVDVELLLKSYKLGFKIKEVPVKHYPRKRGESEAEGGLGLVRPSIIWKTIKDLIMIREDLIRMGK